MCLFHFTVWSSLGGELWFAAAATMEVGLSSGLVGGARSSSKLSLRTGASLQNNPKKASLTPTGASGGSNAPVYSNLGSGEVRRSSAAERRALLVKRSGVAEVNVVKEL